MNAGLLAAMDPDRLMAMARRVRDAGCERTGRRGVVWYGKNVSIPLTRLSRDGRHYEALAAHAAELRANQPVLAQLSRREDLTTPPVSSCTENPPAGFQL